MMDAETLGDLIEAAATRGERPAIIAFQADGKQTVSFRELAGRIRGLSSDLSRQGLQRGGPVLLIGPNSPEWIISYFGILLAGGLPVPLDAQSGPQDVARVAADCGARRVFTARSHVDSLRALITNLPLEVNVWDAAGTPDYKPGASQIAPECPVVLPRLSADDAASLLYTSDTTGTPKAVLLTHRNLMSNVKALATAVLAGPDDRVLLPLPLHHAYPFTAGLLGCLATGATLVFPAGVSGPQLVGALQMSRATVLVGVPRLYAALFDGIEARAHRQGPLARLAFGPLLTVSIAFRRALGLRIGRVIFHRLHREIAPALRLLASGGAKLDETLAWKLEGLGWEVLCGYGLTETAPIVSFNPRGRARIGSAGRLLPGVKVRIAAAAGEQTGEILVRGPNVFAGYRNNPQATAASFTGDGWFKTGDLGWMDRDGYLHVTGRIKEVIVLADGKNVMPEEVEGAYAASPLIREVAIFERDGRIVALVVPDEEGVLRRGAARVDRLLRETIEDVSQRLPPYQRLAEYRLTRTSLPRTHLGKIRRFLLPELYARAESGAPPVVPEELPESDRRLLAGEPVNHVWAWLGVRFAGHPLSLDASPQLDLHIDSLEWVALTLEIHDRFGIALSQDALGRVVTMRDLLNEVAVAASASTTRSTDLMQVRATEARWLSPPSGALRALGWFLYALNKLLMRGLFGLRVEGLENLPAGGPFIIAPNHASYLDGLAIGAAVPWRLLHLTRWAGWTGILFAGAGMRLFSRAVRVFPVDPDRDPAGGFALALATLAQGAVLIWFPEGRRSPDGTIQPFMPGIGSLIQRSGAKAMPTLIQGSFEALPRRRWLPRLHRIIVTFGAPHDAAELEALGMGDSSAVRIASGLRNAVLALDGNAQQPAR
ncbi:MAG TPA: AMP-binding protein [Alphaproteobacteria bacterium]|nr:AMP-binding protein [Alphaproteobacteria bacterium]